MNIQARSKCVCNSKKPHFCPPCFGDPGFYACDPEDIAVNAIELADKLQASHAHLSDATYELEVEESDHQACMEAVADALGLEQWAINEEVTRKASEIRQQRDELAASLEEERGWKREFDMYRRAWIRELGGRLIPKTHEIDALVLTTQRLRKDTQRETMQLCAKALYETVTRADVVALIERWEHE